MKLASAACENQVPVGLFGLARNSRRVSGVTAASSASRSWPRGIGASTGNAGTTTARSEEHTSELQSLMRISYAVFCLKKKKPHKTTTVNNRHHTTIDTH